MVPPPERVGGEGSVDIIKQEETVVVAAVAAATPTMAPMVSRRTARILDDKGTGDAYN